MAYVASTATEVVVTYPRLSWGAIFGGWLVATAVAGLLYVAGLALGFAAFDASDLASTTKGIGIGTGIWFVLTWAAALFLGGMAASWFDNQLEHTMGALQGVAVWGLSLTATALWIAMGLGHAATGGAAVAAAAHGNGGGASIVASGPATEEVAILDEQVHQALRGERNDSAVTAALIASHDDAARRLIEARGASGAEAQRVLASMSAQTQAARNATAAQAERVAHYTSLSMWVSFLSGFLAFLAAAGGGWVGANNLHRVFHLRRYEGRSVRDVVT
ncbi:hypothetical protein [Pinirhizobacter sp.]|jgi:hypothetical protein|uniref:hypothetical protein n=1 Tax=Pinirhizobacter sp. TaxID=2950432 RepID=UPI002F3F8AD7